MSELGLKSVDQLKNISIVCIDIVKQKYFHKTIHDYIDIVNPDIIKIDIKMSL